MDTTLEKRLYNQMDKLVTTRRPLETAVKNLPIDHSQNERKITDISAYVVVALK